MEPPSEKLADEDTGEALDLHSRVGSSLRPRWFPVSWRIFLG
ncbi:hypothetical protein Esi_0585_0002 [Ectocarpus siliculosus]|uniref:Uncharacterized protein n=1 Tax=Ectocarpus siliculosus TaxID=2880 RepID=D7G4X6_ECTSI|nr:hypothetical protein Esi_0585_0002 [Ectocarpus siliculosus]|eukprot:CBJ33739.1 hypothetical protein Esi_0585_0002 [Ectocarpus siliculosus]